MKYLYINLRETFCPKYELSKPHSRPITLHFKEAFPNILCYFVVSFAGKNGKSISRLWTF